MSSIHEIPPQTPQTRFLLLSGLNDTIIRLITIKTVCKACKDFLTTFQIDLDELLPDYVRGELVHYVEVKASELAEVVSEVIGSEVIRGILVVNEIDVSNRACVVAFVLVRSVEEDVS